MRRQFHKTHIRRYSNVEWISLESISHNKMEEVQNAFRRLNFVFWITISACDGCCKVMEQQTRVVQGNYVQHNGRKLRRPLHKARFQ